MGIHDVQGIWDDVACYVGSCHVMQVATVDYGPMYSPKRGISLGARTTGRIRIVRSVCIVVSSRVRQMSDLSNVDSSYSKHTASVASGAHLTTFHFAAYQATVVQCMSRVGKGSVCAFNTISPFFWC